MSEKSRFGILLRKVTEGAWISLTARFKAIKTSPEIEKACDVVTKGLLAIEIVIFQAFLSIDVNKNIILTVAFILLVTSMPLTTSYILMSIMRTREWMSWAKYPIWYLAAYSGFMSIVLLILFVNIAGGISFVLLSIGPWIIYRRTHK